MRKKIIFGKQIEDNVVRSFRMNGIPVQRRGDLDHNHKIDFVLMLGGQKVGVQFTLTKNDTIKAKVAKICALDVVPRFIYLSMANEFFNRPDKRNGQNLYRFLRLIVEKYTDKALSVNIDHHGLQVHVL